MHCDPATHLGLVKPVLLTIPNSEALGRQHADLRISLSGKHYKYFRPISRMLSKHKASMKTAEIIRPISFIHIMTSGCQNSYLPSNRNRNALNNTNKDSIELIAQCN